MGSRPALLPHSGIFIYACRWHGLQTRVLSSLWRLFRGKKRNVLRGRIDSCDYSLDQLLLGTLLFTLLVFLFPTTFVYYLLFFLAYTAIGAVQACIDIFVWVLNHFPLFSVANCLWNPSHHPGQFRPILHPKRPVGPLSSPYSVTLFASCTRNGLWGHFRHPNQLHSSHPALIGLPIQTLNSKIRPPHCDVSPRR